MNEPFPPAIKLLSLIKRRCCCCCLNWNHMRMNLTLIAMVASLFITPTSDETLSFVSEAIKKTMQTSIILDNRDLRNKRPRKMLMEIYNAPLIKSVNCLRAQLGPRDQKEFPYQSL